MKVTLDIETFKQAIIGCSRAIPSGATDQGKDVTRDALLTCEDAMYLTGTSSSVTIEHGFTGTVEQTGRTLVPIMKFKTLIGSMKGKQCTLESSGSKVTVRSGKEKYEFQTQKVDTFPQNRYKASDGFYISGSDLRRAIQRTTLACDVNSTQYALGGCQFSRSGDRLQVAGFDGNQAAIQYLAVKDDLRFLDPLKPVVPAALLITLGSMLADDVVRCEFTGSLACFQWSDVKVSGSTLQGRFPNVDKIAELCRNASTPVRLDCQETSDALARLACTASPETKAIQVSLKPGEVWFQNPKGSLASGAAMVECSYDGEERSIWISAAYAADMVQAVAKTNAKGEKQVDLSILADDRGVLLASGGYLATIAKITQHG